MKKCDTIKGICSALNTEDSVYDPNLKLVLIALKSLDTFDCVLWSVCEWSVKYGFLTFLLQFFFFVIHCFMQKKEKSKEKIFLFIAVVSNYEKLKAK